MGRIGISKKRKYRIMKKHGKYLFVENDMTSVIHDVSDGYIKGFDQDAGKRVKLPHNNYVLLGIVQECIDSPYAEEFSKEIVDVYVEGQDGYRGYCNYLEDSWMYHLQSATNSMRTLIEKLYLNITDYILRDEN